MPETAMTAEQIRDEQIITLAAAGKFPSTISAATGINQWIVHDRLEDPAVQNAIAKRRLDIRQLTIDSHVYYKSQTLDIMFAALLSAPTLNDKCKVARVILHAPEVRMPESSSNRSRATRARLEDLEAVVAPAPAAPLEVLENLEATRPAPVAKPLEVLENLEAPPAAQPLEFLENLEAPVSTPAAKPLENLEAIAPTPAGKPLENLEGTDGRSTLAGAAASPSVTARPIPLSHLNRAKRTKMTAGLQPRVTRPIVA